MWRNPFRPTPEHLIDIRLSRSALVQNYAAVRAVCPDWGVAPVVKASAYGHGLVPFTKMLESVARFPFICADSLHEAYVLRRAGIRSPLLVFDYASATMIATSRLRDVTFALSSLEHIRAVCHTGARVRVHVKVDTGMHRQGILAHEIDDAIALLHKNKQVVVEGLFSHFAESEDASSSLTKHQITVWNVLVAQWRSAFPACAYYHIANTDGWQLHDTVDANVGRTGRALYGVATPALAVRPVLSMYSRVASVRMLAPGDRVGYNGTYIAEAPMQVALVPVGYAEGVDRRLSNTGTMSVGGRPARILGRVSMNMSTLDVTGMSTVLNDDVCVIAADASAPNSIEVMARTCGTIPYELLVHLPYTAHRRVVD